MIVLIIITKPLSGNSLMITGRGTFVSFGIYIRFLDLCTSPRKFPVSCVFQPLLCLNLDFPPHYLGSYLDRSLCRSMTSVEFHSPAACAQLAWFSAVHRENRHNLGGLVCDLLCLLDWLKDRRLSALQTILTGVKYFFSLSLSLNRVKQLFCWWCMLVKPVCFLIGCGSQNRYHIADWCGMMSLFSPFYTDLSSCSKIVWLNTGEGNATFSARAVAYARPRWNVISTCRNSVWPPRGWKG